MPCSAWRSLCHSWGGQGYQHGGQASKELLPLTYSFSMNYAFARQEKGGQNVAANPIVAFQTANVTVELRDSAGNLIPDGAGTGAVQYYAGGWRTFGATAGAGGAGGAKPDEAGRCAVGTAAPPGEPHTSQ